MTQRRLLLLALGASLSGHTALLRAQTSSGAMRRVGVLGPSTRAKDEITLKPFFDQMCQNQSRRVRRCGCQVDR